MSLPDLDVDSARKVDTIATMESYGLEFKREGSEFVALCPFHDDHTPSLSVNPGKGAWRCRSCGIKGGDAISFVEQHQNCTFPEAVRRINGESPSGNTAPVRTKHMREKPAEEWRLYDVVPDSARDLPIKPGAMKWAYRNEDGRVLFYTVRLDKPGGEKDILPLTYWASTKTGDEQWRWKGYPKGEYGKSLYGAELLAKYPNAQVIVVEGEKTCDAIRAHLIGLGLAEKVVAVTWCGGVDNVGYADLRPLYGRKVGLWPDADAKRYKEGHPKAGEIKQPAEQPGNIAMFHIAKRIDAHCPAPVKFFTPPQSVPDGWDLADEFPEGFDLFQHLKSARFVTDVLKDCGVENAPAPEDQAAQEMRDYIQGKGGAANDGDTVPRRATKWLGDKLKEMEPTKWLIKGVIARDLMHFMFGESATGKSFLAIDMAVCIATGTEWFGHKVRQGAVVYAAGEGGNSIPQRFMACGIHRDLDLTDANIAISDTPVMFNDQDAAKNYARALKREMAERGVEPGVVFVDTLAKNFSGEENSSKDTGAFIRNLEVELRQVFKCAIVVIHHSGKDASKGMRGSSAIKAGIDRELPVTIDESGVRRFESDKIKDGKPIAPLCFKLKDIELVGYVDEDGDPMSSAAVESIPYRDKAQKGKQGSGAKQLGAMQVLHELEAHHREMVQRDGRFASDANVIEREWRDIVISKGLASVKHWSEFKSSLINAGKIATDVAGFVWSCESSPF